MDSLGVGSLGVVVLGVTEPPSDSLRRREGEDFFLASKSLVPLSSGHISQTSCAVRDLSVIRLVYNDSTTSGNIENI